MVRIEETALPGVGVRHDFSTRNGQRIGVISHRDGRRELLVYDRRDPDACSTVLPLDEEDVRTLADLLGGSQVVERFDRLRQSVAGLTIDWLPIAPGSPWADRTLAEIGLRKSTGVSIVAVNRDDEITVSPPADYRLAAGDVLVCVGSASAITAAEKLASGG